MFSRAKWLKVKHYIILIGFHHLRFVCEIIKMMVSLKSVDQDGEIMEHNIPNVPNNATRIVIELTWPESRLDNVLLEKIRNEEDAKLRSISRGTLKKMFHEGKVQIKGQNAKPSSSLAKGTTYVDLFC